MPGAESSFQQANPNYSPDEFGIRGSRHRPSAEPGPQMEHPGLGLSESCQPALHSSAIVPTLEELIYNFVVVFQEFRIDQPQGVSLSVEFPRPPSRIRSERFYVFD